MSGWEPTRMRVAVLAAAMVVALAAGVAALVLQGDDDAPRAAMRETRTHKGDLELAIPPGWVAAKSPPSIPGLELSDAFGLVQQGTDTRVVAGRGAFTTPSLLPATLLSRLQLPPGAPATVRIGRRLQAYYYGGLLPADSNGSLEVYVVPTTRGVATVACASSQPAALSTSCWDVVRTLRLLRGRGLKPSRLVAFGQRLRDEVEALQRRREMIRPVLERAQTRAAQADAALALAAAYAEAGSRLAPLVPSSRSPAGRVVAQLRRTGRAYKALADALRGSQAAAVASASQAARSAEAELARLLERAGGAGT